MGCHFGKGNHKIQVGRMNPFSSPQSQRTWFVCIAGVGVTLMSQYSVSTFDRQPNRAQRCDNSLTSQLIYPFPQFTFLDNDYCFLGGSGMGWVKNQHAHSLLSLSFFIFLTLIKVKFVSLLIIMFQLHLIRTLNSIIINQLIFTLCFPFDHDLLVSFVTRIGV